MERIPGAGAPNLERVLTGGPGVGGEDGGELEWHANIQPAGGPLVPNRIRTEGRGKRSQKWPCAGLQKGGTRRSHVGWYGWLGVKDRRTGWQPAFPMMCHKGKWWCHLPEGGSSWSSPHRKRDYVLPSLLSLSCRTVFQATRPFSGRHRVMKFYPYPTS